MLFSNDKNSNRVYAIDAEPNEEYFCPICNHSVILKCGEINAAHFAHKSNTCYDDWNYDMSEWHKIRQSLFPKECQEVVVKNKYGKTHRADVLINNTVIEFQHSSITANEFDDRNNFFLGLGYRLVWVFDVSSEFDNNIEDHDSNRKIYKWKYPKRIFQNAPEISDFNKRFSMWFSLGYELDDFVLDKVIWAIDEDGVYSFKCFRLGETLDLECLSSIDEFFLSKYDIFNNKLKKLSKKAKYTIKHIGQKGFKYEDYLCPITKKWASESANNGRSGCSHCRHCGILKIKWEKGGKAIYDSYCCYPNVINTPDRGDPEYEAWVDKMEF